jgi:hypothetical protein
MYSLPPRMRGIICFLIRYRVSSCRALSLGANIHNVSLDHNLDQMCTVGRSSSFTKTNKFAGPYYNFMYVVCVMHKRL